MKKSCEIYLIGWKYILIVIFSLSFLFSETTNAQYWTALGGGSISWANAVAEYNGELYLGTDAGIIRWNGTLWSQVGGGIIGEVDALCVYNGKLYAGGSFFDAGGVQVSNIASWDGLSWADPEGGTDNIVASLTVYNGKLIVGGYFTSANGPANHIASWDDSNWAPLGSGMSGLEGQVMALTVYNGELVAGGFFTGAGGVPASHIAKWNGTSWSPLGSGISNIVYALTVYQGRLIAGGLFLSAGGIPANDVAAWDGTSWSALGSGIGGGLYPYVLGLTVYGNDLIAAGLYQQAGGIISNGAARWNGSAWSPLNGGFTSPSNVAGAYAVCVYNNEIVFAGIFTGAGGIGSANVAAWVMPPVTQTVQNIVVGAGEINCYSAAQTITVAGSGTTFTVQPGGSATFIAGTSVSLLPGASVLEGGEMFAYISPDGPYCNVFPASPVTTGYADGSGVQTGRFSGYRLVPNPTRNTARLQSSAGPDPDWSVLELTDLQGLVLEKVVNSEGRQPIVDLSGVMPGVYIVRVQTGTGISAMKLIRVQ